MGWGNDNLFSILNATPTAPARDLRRDVDGLIIKADMGLLPPGFNRERFEELRRTIDDPELLLHERFRAPLLEYDANNIPIGPAKVLVNDSDRISLTAHDELVNRMTVSLTAPWDASAFGATLNTTTTVFDDATFWDLFGELTVDANDARAKNALQSMRENREQLILDPLLKALNPAGCSMQTLQPVIAAVRRSSLSGAEKDLLADRITAGVRAAADEAIEEFDAGLNRLRGIDFERNRGLGRTEFEKVLHHLRTRWLPAIETVGQIDPGHTNTKQADEFARDIRQLSILAFNELEEGATSFGLIQRAALLAKSPNLIQQCQSDARLVSFQYFRELGMEHRRRNDIIGSLAALGIAADNAEDPANRAATVNAITTIRSTARIGNSTSVDAKIRERKIQLSQQFRANAEKALGLQESSGPTLGTSSAPVSPTTPTKQQSISRTTHPQQRLRLRWGVLGIAALLISLVTVMSISSKNTSSYPSSRTVHTPKPAVSTHTLTAPTNMPAAINPSPTSRPAAAVPSPTSNRSFEIVDSFTGPSTTDYVGEWGSITTGDDVITFATVSGGFVWWDHYQGGKASIYDQRFKLTVDSYLPGSTLFIRILEPGTDCDWWYFVDPASGQWWLKAAPVAGDINDSWFWIPPSLLPRGPGSRVTSFGVTIVNGNLGFEVNNVTVRSSTKWPNSPRFRGQVRFGIGAGADNQQSSVSYSSASVSVIR